MSLLMDALKRAEEAKRQKANAAPEAASPAFPAAGEIALEPLAAEAPSSGLPDLHSHEDAVDKELRDTADHGDLDLQPARKAPEAPAESRHVAQNVFAAKAPLVDERRRQKKSVFLIIGAGSLAGVAIAGYFWYQLQAIAGGSGLRVVAPDLRAAAPGPRGAGSLSTGGPPNPPLATAPATNGPAAPSPASEVPAAADAAAAPTVRVAAVRTKRAAAQPRRATPTRSTTAAAPPEKAPEHGVSIDVGKAPESPLMRAYAAWQAGDADAARALYGDVLRRDANQVDALLGLATLAVRDGERQRAEILFSRALEVDPRNATAHAGLLALRGNADANQAESRLKTLLAQSNDPAARSTLSFALGNVYAEQQRWNEAQQAYFKAHVGDADNPDYAYNLAVSLDRLGQPSLARRYYAAALELAGRRPGAFDRQLAETRLGQLAP